MNKEVKESILRNFKHRLHYEGIEMLLNIIAKQDKKIEALEKKVAKLDGENSLNRPLKSPPLGARPRGGLSDL